MKRRCVKCEGKHNRKDRCMCKKCEKAYHKRLSNLSWDDICWMLGVGNWGQ